MVGIYTLNHNNPSPLLFLTPKKTDKSNRSMQKRCRFRTESTLYVGHSVLLLKASVAITRCNSFKCVAPHGARYLLAYSIARILFSDLTNSMNSCSLNWNSNLLCHQKKQDALIILRKLIQSEVSTSSRKGGQEVSPWSD